ncbi:MAG: dual specificity protein phosphatase family protein [Sedimentisphaerales bacterium]|nr:dual specificity protein phosphatase family protein [Sedimentisphaerales bacterium]
MSADENAQSENKPHRNSHLRTIIAILLLAIGGGLWLWEDVLKDRFIPKRWGTVVEGQLYRSGRLHPALVKDVLTEHNIQVIIDLTGDQPGHAEQEAEKQAAQELGIERVSFPLGGNGTGDINNYAGAIQTIVEAQQANKPVWIHCAAGSQRTGGVIACYRMLIENAAPSTAYAEMVQYDWDPVDDVELLTFINENMAELAALLYATQTIDQIPDPLPQLAP